MRKKRRITRKELKTIYEIGYSFVRKVKFDHVSSFAGHAALFLLMSIFPMAMFCISIFSYLPIDIGRLTQYLLTIIPEGSLPLVNQILAEAYAGSTTIMTSFTMLVMLFCASKGVYAVIIGMNAVYGIRETRGTMLLYALAAAYVVIFFAAIGLMMILIVLGNNIFNWLLQFVPGMIAFDRLFRYGKYLCMLVFLLVFFLPLGTAGVHSWSSATSWRRALKRKSGSKSGSWMRSALSRIRCMLSMGRKSWTEPSSVR